MPHRAHAEAFLPSEVRSWEAGVEKRVEAEKEGGQDDLGRWKEGVPKRKKGEQGTETITGTRGNKREVHGGQEIE